jgi:hypothetical protein
MRFRCGQGGASDDWSVVAGSHEVVKLRAHVAKLGKPEDLAHVASFIVRPVIGLRVVLKPEVIHIRVASQHRKRARDSVAQIVGSVHHCVPEETHRKGFQRLGIRSFPLHSPSLESRQTYAIPIGSPLR